jgi:hypothetical protein
MHSLASRERGIMSILPPSLSDSPRLYSLRSSLLNPALAQTLYLHLRLDSIQIPICFSKSTRILSSQLPGGIPWRLHLLRLIDRWFNVHLSQSFQRLSDRSADRQTIRSAWRLCKKLLAIPSVGRTPVKSRKYHPNDTV